MAERPSKLKFGPFKYKVKYDSGLLRKGRAMGGEEAYGFCLHDELTIVVEEELAAQVEKSTVVHEAFHALIKTYGIRFSSDEKENFEKEEAFVMAFGNAFLGLAQDNAEFMEWLSS